MLYLNRSEEYAIVLLKDEEWVERKDNRIGMGEIRFIPVTEISV
jgi:hypothetical protein